MSHSTSHEKSLSTSLLCAVPFQKKIYGNCVGVLWNIYLSCKCYEVEPGDSGAKREGGVKR
jgi:hypothetical protein